VAPFRINDRVYGRTFFVLTGFHGFHVIIGLLGLIIILFILCRNFNFTQRLKIFLNKSFPKIKFIFDKTEFMCLHRFLRLEFAFIYWHFVDVV
jgi:heme/copper-type cytochrome/quinol oxidase subunit 3